MLGTCLSTPGGMTSVVRTLKDAGLFKAFNIRYIASYEGPGLSKQLRVMLSACLQFIRLLFSGRVASVHVHSASRGSFWRKSVFCSLAKLFRVPYVFQIHSGEFPDFYDLECGAFAKWWIRMTLRNAFAVICLTPSWREKIEAIEPQSRIVIIGNPVEILDQLPVIRHIPVNVLFLGRLREKKGVFDLVQAMPEVLMQCPQLRFIFAGDEGTEMVRAQALSLGVEGAVDLPGWVDGAEKAKLLENADIFVLPSYFEGLPVGVLEAMALGIPVVTTPVGGIPDFIENNVNGLLVTPGDSKMLAAALVRLGLNFQLRNSLREAAFVCVNTRYSLSVVLSEISELYTQLGCKSDFKNVVH